MKMPGKLPPLNLLRAFEAVARLGGVSAAADELYVTHSAVSQQRKGWQSRRIDQIGNVLAVFLRFLGHSMLLEHC